MDLLVINLGTRFFKCWSCGHEFTERTDDVTNPTGRDCPNCKDAFVYAHKKQPDQPKPEAGK